MGALARDGLHPDLVDDLPVEVFCDAAWAAWVDILLRVDGQERLDALTDTWDGLNAPLEAAAGPSMDDWGTSDKAQAGAAGLMAMMGGSMPPPPNEER